MKNFWLIAAGAALGYSMGTFRSMPAPALRVRDSVLLSRIDLGELSRAIDLLARADTSRIYRYEAKLSPLSLECAASAETSTEENCRLETVPLSTHSFSAAPTAASQKEDGFEVTPLAEPTLTRGRSLVPNKREGLSPGRIDKQSRASRTPI